MKNLDTSLKIESCFISVNNYFKALQRKKRIAFKKLHPGRKVDIRLSIEEQKVIIMEQCASFNLSYECFMKIFKGEIK